jgi:hypothetical protein
MVVSAVAATMDATISVAAKSPAGALTTAMFAVVAAVCLVKSLDCPLMVGCFNDLPSRRLMFEPTSFLAPKHLSTV